MKKLLLLALLLPLMISCTPTELAPGEGIISIEKDGKKWKGLEIDARFNSRIPDTWILTISKEGNSNRLSELLTFSNIPPKKGMHTIGRSIPGEEPEEIIFPAFGTLDYDIPIDNYSLEENPENSFEISSFDPSTNEAIGSFRVTLFDGEGSDKKTITFTSDEFRVIVK
ncbi:MAG: hypothetical protein R8P61_32735 [Bacteroidia bacterium]|nr:hypothetical protein [Bacteroidia bacterium]